MQLISLSPAFLSLKNYVFASFAALVLILEANLYVATWMLFHFSHKDGVLASKIKTRVAKKSKNVVVQKKKCWR